MQVEIVFFGKQKNCAAYHAAVCCEKALGRLGVQTTFKNTCQELFTPSKTDWSLSFGEVPEDVFSLKQNPHLHWALEPSKFEFSLEHPHLWLGSPCKIAHQKHLFLPHAIEPVILPRLPTRFPIVLFENLTEHSPLESLLNELGPIPVHVFGQHQGANWLKKLKHGHLRFLHPPLPFHEHQRVLQQAQLLLLLQPTLVQVSPPWVLTALSAGCLVLSMTNPYMQQLFKGYEELLVSSESRTLTDQIQQLLAQPQHIQELLAQMQKQLLPQHSWEKRVEYIACQLLKS